MHFHNSGVKMIYLISLCYGRHDANQEILPQLTYLLDTMYLLTVARKVIKLHTREVFPSNKKVEQTLFIEQLNHSYKGPSTPHSYGQVFRREVRQSV